MLQAGATRARRNRMLDQGHSIGERAPMNDPRYKITAYAAMLFTLAVALTAVFGLVERLT
jgi:hypothetical protein